MAVTKTPALILKGALGAFHQKMATMPQVWKNHVMEVPSTTAKETYAFPGMLPIPRVFEGARNIQGFRDFKFDITNSTYELTLLIDLEDFEDDQTGTIRSRFTDLAEVFGTYKDQLFAALLQGGSAAAPPFGDADGITWTYFYDTGMVVGDATSILNWTTTNITLPAGPTIAEFQTAWKLAKDTLWTMPDDMGRPIFNSTAMSQVRLVVPPAHDYITRQFFNSSFTVDPTVSTGSGENVWKGDAAVDVLPYLTDADSFFVNALGSERKPFIFQNRKPLEIVVDTTPEGMQERNGVLVMCRERFKMAYGDPRRSYQQIFT